MEALTSRDVKLGLSPSEYESAVREAFPHLDYGVGQPGWNPADSTITLALLAAFLADHPTWTKSVWTRFFGIVRAGLDVRAPGLFKGSDEIMAAWRHWATSAKVRPLSTPKLFNFTKSGSSIGPPVGVRGMLMWLSTKCRNLGDTYGLAAFYPFH